MDEDKPDSESLDTISGQDLLDLIIESEVLHSQAKREVAAWLRTRGWLDLDQYGLAVSRIKHIEKQS